jgi:KDO2-lipid IV(A) lauroyltransferase
MPLGKAVRGCLNALQENKVIGLAADRDFTKKGQVVDFFAKPTFLPEGAAAFALKTGTSIIPGFMLRNPDDSFTFKFEQPINFITTNDKQRDLIELIKRCKIVIEDYIRRYPDQWYMFRKFWIS